MKSFHYLDCAATTKTIYRPEYIDMFRNWGNPSSKHQYGRLSKNIVEESREKIADVLSCKSDQVIFTSSGTESNNIAIFGHARANSHNGRHIVSTGYEHPSVFNPLLALIREGYDVDFVSPGKDGLVDIKEIIGLVRSDTILVTSMHINNETGAYVDVSNLAKEVKAKNQNTRTHVDGVQGFKKVPIVYDHIDSYSISGHKFGAPKGIGALRCNAETLEQIMYGGSQEFGIRPGTENVPYIYWMCDVATTSYDHSHVMDLHAFLVEGLIGLGITINSPIDGPYYGIVNASIPGIESQEYVRYLSDNGIYVSGGSACSEGKPSHTLTAMGLPDEIIRSSIRISFDGNTSKNDIYALLNAIQWMVNRIVL